VNYSYSLKEVKALKKIEANNQDFKLEDIIEK